MIVDRHYTDDDELAGCDGPSLFGGTGISRRHEELLGT
jgi:hypothetical protein